MERKNMKLYCDSILQNLYIGSKEVLDVYAEECTFHFVVNCTVDYPYLQEYELRREQIEELRNREGKSAEDLIGTFTWEQLRIYGL